MKINYNDNYLENNNSHRMKNNNNIDNKTKIGVKMSPNNSKLGFYLPQLNSGKTINHEFSNHNINPNGKLRNKLNISQFRFKINHNNKKGFLNNKLLIIPGNNYQPLFKRSESSGFMNFGTNIPNKTKRGNRNDFNRKNLVGISNSLINNGYNYNNDKRLFRNASDLFH